MLRLAPELGAGAHAQVKAPGEQEAALPPPRALVSTFTDVNARSTFVEPHEGQGGKLPSEYALIDMRTPKE